MNIALSTLAIVLALLPGMFAWNTYFSGQLNRRLFGFSPLSELAQYIVAAIPLNALGTRLFLGWERGAEIAGEFWGVVVQTPAPEQLQRFITDYGWTLFWSYAALVGGAIAVGAVLRWLVWILRLDLMLPFLRPRHHWYYLLRGRLPGLPRRPLAVGEILARLPEDKSRLYRGVVDRFTVADDGSLRELVLSAAQRGKGRGQRFHWLDIPGDQLTLLGAEIHSINMQYVEIRSEQSLRDRVWSAVRSVTGSILRRILFGSSR